jgi:hypothetical protein
MCPSLLGSSLAAWALYLDLDESGPTRHSDAARLDASVASGPFVRGKDIDIALQFNDHQLDGFLRSTPSTNACPRARTASAACFKDDNLPEGVQPDAKMRILIDIVHPADVLFFRRPVQIFAEAGHNVMILSRRKDVTCELLDEFGLPHTPVSTAGRGLIQLSAEMARRTMATFAAARRFRPDVMLGFGGVSIAHAGWVLRIPSVAFYDTENATMQTRVTWPFISQLYVPQAYTGPTPRNRTQRLAGVKELSYLHPGSFVPQRSLALEAGLDPTRDNFLVRLVEWRANHDIGKKGWDENSLRALVGRLPGRVHISSEVSLPTDLEPLRYRGKLSKIHHLLGHCRLFVGESASMAAESAVLGVPSVYAADFRLGYLDDLVAAGLMIQVATESLFAGIDAALALCRSEVVAARDRYVSQCPDWGMKVVEAAYSVDPTFSAGSSHPPAI